MGYEEFCQHLELCTEKVVVVHLADGDTITTRIHGTDEDIRAYYRVGSVLNMGAEHDRLVAVVAVDIMEPPGNAPHGPVNELQRQEDGIGVKSHASRRKTLSWADLSISPENEKDPLAGCVSCEGVYVILRGY